ncbi:DNA-3-methyladenine glycosylase family protein [Rhizobium sp. YIM 134829]|uniref:DNA-3-methyladenine glycosylase family protein n=1 Tax=Rhizobium sp. YIM 134829 TaxID=3390453 RepID=UPI00397C68B8
MTAALIETHADIALGLEALLRDDPRLAPVIAQAGEIPLRRTAPGYAGLAFIIVSQMISKASAAAIWSRMEARMGAVGPEAVALSSDEDFRADGLSRAKILTLRHAAEAVLEERIDLVSLCTDEAQAAMRNLCTLPGIGPWTAEVYLLFCAGHPDIFPSGDVALQAAVAHGLGLGERPSAAALSLIATKWAPWRSVAARLFWAYYATAMGRRGAPAPGVSTAEAQAKNPMQ